MPTISGRDLRKQLKADLIGKDSYRGVTLTYAWLANQFGHIGLGFIPTVILHKILSIHYPHAAIRAPAIIAAVWLLFETYNFLGPLLSKKQTSSKITFVAGSKYIFQPDWKNVGLDTATDVLFFWLGACLAGLLCNWSVYLFIALLIIAAVLIIPTAYWYKTKMYVQVPGYPFQFRLSQWEFLNLDESDKKRIVAFRDNQEKGKHLFLFGPQGSGKTSLGVALATEISIKHQACLYTTATKLYNQFSQTEAVIPGTKALWTWRTSDVLIIDDINPGNPVSDIVTPDMFLRLLNTDLADENKTAFRNVTIIWILGNMEYTTQKLDPWKGMLKSIGVQDKNISCINLLSKKYE